MTFTQYYKPDDMSASVPEHLQTDEDLQQQIMDINLLYSAAIREVSTKLDVLGDDFRMKHSYVPIHHMQSRLKSFESLMDKAERYGIEDPIHNLDTVRAEVFDIAGIRVVCNYREDIYTMSELLLKQSDVDLIKIKDYCKNPKPSGYRSLHVVISIPVFLVNSKTTAVRVIPAIGRKAGEVLDFGGLLGYGPIMPVNSHDPSVFINRGGRLPAPMQSLKN